MTYYVTYYVTTDCNNDVTKLIAIKKHTNEMHYFKNISKGFD